MKCILWVSSCVFWMVSLSAQAQKMNFEWAEQWGNYKSPGGGIWDDEGNFGYPDFYNFVVGKDGSTYFYGALTGTFDPDPQMGGRTKLSTTYPTTAVTESFVIKLNPNGKFEWAKMLPPLDGKFGLRSVYGRISIDKDDNLFVFSNYNSEAFMMNIQLVKLSSNGNIIWEKELSNVEQNIVSAAAFDDDGNIYLGGYFAGLGLLPYPDGTMDFDPGPETHTLTPKEEQHDCFLLKLNSNGNFVWVRQLGGFIKTRFFAPSILTLDVHQDKVYMTGIFSGEQDFDPEKGEKWLTTNPVNENYATKGFVAQLNTVGSLNWVHPIENSDNSLYVDETSIDASGNLFITGEFYGTLKFDDNHTISSAFYHRFVAKIDPVGNYVWIKAIKIADKGFDISMTNDAFGNVYMVSNFRREIDFNPDKAGSNILKASGDYNDMFVLKLNANGSYNTAFSYGREHGDRGKGVQVDPQGNLYLFGMYTGPGAIDVDPNETVHNLKPSFGSEFVVKLSQPNLSAGCTLNAGQIQGASREICDGGEVELTINVSGDNSPFHYQWMLNDKKTGADSPRLTASATGTYTVTITDSEQCSVTSPPLTLTNGKSPDAPILSTQLSELLSGQTTEITSSVSSGYHFQWLKDGSPIGGATQNNLTVSEPGAYRLTITSEWGCAATSREIVIRKSLITAIEPERNGIEVSFFPNPFVREATAKVTMDTPSGITITLLDTQGKALYEEIVLTVADVHHVPLDLSQYHSGLYFLVVKSDKATFTRKILKP